MLIRAGFEIRVRTDGGVPLLLALSPHPETVWPAYRSGAVDSTPAVPVATYTDGFGNRIGRVVTTAGEMQLVSDFVVHDSGLPDPVVPEAPAQPVETLPEATLQFLMPSRFVESDLIADEAWARFGAVPGGWARVQAVCDFVHDHLEFGYGHGRATKTAMEALREGTGVCRDFAHLSIAFCRALNIPARYASGYLGDIGVPYGGPMDFCAWFEVWLGGRWYTFDARYNVPRIGRILMVRGRDAADVAMITSFGAHAISHFEVWAEELPATLGPAEIEALLRTPAPAPQAFRRSA